MFFLYFLVAIFSPLAVFAAPYELPPVSSTETQGLLETASPARAVSDLYNFALGLGAIAAFGLIVYSALQYTTTDSPGKRQEAQGRIYQSLLGLLLLLGATVVLRFINPDLPQLQNPGVQPLPSAQVERDTTQGGASYYTLQICPTSPSLPCSDDASYSQASDQGSYTSREACEAVRPGGGQPGDWRCVERFTGRPSALEPTDAGLAEQREGAVRAQLRDAGISVNNKPCTPYTARFQEVAGGCTNVGGVPNYVIDKLITLNQQFKVRISGGSEAGHSQHGVGQPVVDLTPGYERVSSRAEWCELGRLVNELGVAFSQYEKNGVKVDSCNDNPDHFHVKFN